MIAQILQNPHDSTLVDNVQIPRNVQNLIFFDVDGVLNSTRDYDRFDKDTWDCFVHLKTDPQESPKVNNRPTIISQPFGRANKHQLRKFQELVEFANAKMYMISSWAIACRMESLVNAYEDLRDFFGFEFVPMSGVYDADARAFHALEVLNDLDSKGIAYKAIFVDDMHDFKDSDQLESLKSKCLMVHPRGSIGLTDEEFTLMRDYFN